LGETRGRTADATRLGASAFGRAHSPPLERGHPRADRARGFPRVEKFISSRCPASSSLALLPPRPPGQHPAVLCPQLTWGVFVLDVLGRADNGTRTRAAAAETAAAGGRRFSTLGVQLARMGIVAFQLRPCSATASRTDSVSRSRTIREAALNDHHPEINQTDILASGVLPESRSRLASRPHRISSPIPSMASPTSRN